MGWGLKLRVISDWTVERWLTRCFGASVTAGKPVFELIRFPFLPSFNDSKQGQNRPGIQRIEHILLY